MVKIAYGILFYPPRTCLASGPWMSRAALQMLRPVKGPTLSAVWTCRLCVPADQEYMFKISFNLHFGVVTTLCLDTENIWLGSEEDQALT